MSAGWGEPGYTPCSSRPDGSAVGGRFTSRFCHFLAACLWVSWYLRLPTLQMIKLNP